MDANKKSLVLFVALTFTLTWGAIGIARSVGLQYGTPVFNIVLMGCMFCPALSSILTRLILKEGFRGMMLRPRFRGNAKPYLLAYFLPTLVVLLGGALYFLIYPGMFDTAFSALRTSLPDATSKTLLMVILTQTAMAILIGPIINIVPTLGEELGWRAFLLPRLTKRMSTRRAILLSGFVWGAWHAPMIALGHNYGLDYAGYPYVGIALMIVFCILFGAFESYITLKSKSVIPAAIAHSGLNAIAGLPALFTLPGYNPTVGPLCMGLLSGIPVLIAGVYFFFAAGKLSFDDAPDAACSAPEDGSAAGDAGTDASVTDGAPEDGSAAGDAPGTEQ